MDNENQSADLTAEESAYFESGGETAPVAAPAVVEPEQQEQPVSPEQTSERDEKNQFVSHRALHAEREEHKKTKAQLEEIARKQAVLEDRWNTVLTLKQQGEPEAPAIPDPAADIFGYLKHQADEQKAFREQIAAREQQESQQRQAAQQEQEIWGAWRQSAAEYSAQTPEFGDALKFLSETRTKQLTALSVVDPRFVDPAEINNQINAELKGIITAAKQKGDNPAAIVHKLAAAFGFSAGGAGMTPGNAELPKQLAQIGAAQAAARTVASGQGGNATDPLTPEAIASMSSAEFDAWMKEPANQRRFDKMMGA